MIKTGILNPVLLSLLARIRHTNMLVISDCGFPSWPEIETVDISLITDIPTVLQVLRAVRAQVFFGQAYMAEEFIKNNDQDIQSAFASALEGIPISYEPHEAKFKPRVPKAIGLIRTGDSTPYSNLILVSA